MLESRILRVFELSVSRHVVGAGIHSAGLTRKSTQRLLLTHGSQAYAEHSLNVPCPIINSVRKTNRPLFVSIDETALENSLMRLTAYAPRGSLLFCVHGNVSWTWSCVIATIASCRACATALHEAGVDGSKYLDDLASLYFSSGTCLIKDVPVSHSSSVEWNSIRLLMQPTAKSSMESRRRSP
jgi:hypothetical protein